MPAQLNVFLPLPLTDRGPAYTCGTISRGMACSTLDITIFTPRARRLPVSPATVLQTLPHWARRLPYKWVRSRANAGFETTFLSHHKGSNTVPRAAYIWPDASAAAIRSLRRADITTFREMINCPRRTAKAILDEAYRMIGAPPRHGITEASAIHEQEALEAVDYIFCANAMVEQSLLENGIPRSKLISASYGWDPARFSGLSKLLPPHPGPTFVFAGTICVRKGCHLLLDYWARSNVRGRLVLAGRLEDTIRERCADLLRRDDVVVLDFVPDVASLYRSADIFVFPTLEEGGPQVTYEACGCALPVITTPMGAGRIARHNKEGFVLDPYDASGWIDAIRILAADPYRRASMSRSAQERAKSFHWDIVAAARRHQILNRLDSRGVCDAAPVFAGKMHDGVLVN
jgi:glycosyltransferase involved in cell wall biosynthesis